MSSRVEEFRANYQRMEDDELLELAGQLDQLMPDARIALWAEIGRRGITEQAEEARDAAAPRAVPASAPDVAAPDLPEWNLLNKPPELPSSDYVAVLSVADVSEAQRSQELLRAEGIESQLQIVILVPQAEAEKALRIVSEQIDPGADLTSEPDEEPQG
jgi:hypothetical protein